MSEERVRPGAGEIYESVKLDAAEELDRPSPALAFSGLFAGATLGFGGLAAAGAATAVGNAASAELVGALFYPIGFVATIVGRAQLFTENALYPLTLVLDERRHLGAMLRLWVVVLLALVAWTIEASDHAIGQIAVIWGLTFVTAISSFDHCVSTTSEVLSAVINCTVSTSHFLTWLSAVILGNIVGGVVIVGVLNYGQVRAGEN